MIPLRQSHFLRYQWIASFLFLYHGYVIKSFLFCFNHSCRTVVSFCISSFNLLFLDWPSRCLITNLFSLKIFISHDRKGIHIMRMNYCIFKLNNYLNFIKYRLSLNVLVSLKYRFEFFFKFLPIRTISFELVHCLK